MDIQAWNLGEQLGKLEGPKQIDGIKSLETEWGGEERMSEDWVLGQPDIKTLEEEGQV